MKLRPYQEEAVDNTLEGWKTFKRQLMVMPTGGGKTIVFSKIVDETPGKSLILAHREELILQAQDKLRKTTGKIASVEMGAYKARPGHEVVIASVQTMTRRLDKWPKGIFENIIIDEAHHAMSDSYLRVINHFDANLLGVTATPDRGDKRDLGRIFENICFEISLFQLIKEGYLSPIKIRTVPFEIDLGKITKRGGDFKEEEVGAAIAPFLRQITEKVLEYAWDRKTLIFLPLRKISRAMAEHLRDMGVTAEHIEGESSDRQEILARFASGETQFLTNAMLLTEGFDDPSIDCVVPLRATASRTLFSQMVGRGTRISPGKTDLAVLDFLWGHEKHNLCSPASLVAESEEIAEIMDSKAVAAAAREEELELFEVLEEAKDEVERRLLRKIREANRAKKEKESRVIDALSYAVSLHDLSAADYFPVMEWEGLPVTDKQKSALFKFGIDPGTVTCKGHANAILGTAYSRSKMGLASPKQVDWLRKLGHPNPESATRKEASDFMDEKWGKKPVKT